MVAVWITVFFVAIIVLDIFGTLGYPEEGFWSSCLKLLVTVMFIIAGTYSSPLPELNWSVWLHRKPPSRERPCLALVSPLDILVGLPILIVRLLFTVKETFWRISVIYITFDHHRFADSPHRRRTFGQQQLRCRPISLRLGLQACRSQGSRSPLQRHHLYLRPFHRSFMCLCRFPNSYHHGRNWIRSQVLYLRRQVWPTTLLRTRSTCLRLYRLRQHRRRRWRYRLQLVVGFIWSLYSVHLGQYLLVPYSIPKSLKGSGTRCSRTSLPSDVWCLGILGWVSFDRLGLDRSILRRCLARWWDGT